MLGQVDDRVRIAVGDHLRPCAPSAGELVEHHLRYLIDDVRWS